MKVTMFRSMGRTIGSWVSHDDVKLHNLFGGHLQFTDMVDEIEEALLAYTCPTLDEVEATNDANTPMEDLLLIAEAYRYAGLLQLYRACPHLLRIRLSLIEGNWAFHHNHDNACEEAVVDKFLLGLATRTLEIIAKISPESGTRNLQPLILIMVANELRLDTQIEPTSRDAVPDDTQNEGPVYAREFLWARLLHCVQFIALHSTAFALDIVKETWAKMDMGKRVFWLEITIKNGWEGSLG